MNKKMFTFILVLATLCGSWYLGTPASASSIMAVKADNGDGSEDNDSSMLRKKMWQDSIINSTKDNFFGTNRVFQLSERYSLNYVLEFFPIDSVDLHLNIARTFVVDSETNDTINVEMLKHCYALLSKSPLVIVNVFEVHFDGHEYVVHDVFDKRNEFWIKDKEFKTISPEPALRCFQIW